MPEGKHRNKEERLVNLLQAAKSQELELHCPRTIKGKVYNDVVLFQESLLSNSLCLILCLVTSSDGMTHYTRESQSQVENQSIILH